ncbi:MAG TPA: hypothetical protein VGL42_07805 [Opitutaceae bacterium]|jgi:hypothetical protein
MNTRLKFLCLAMVMAIPAFAMAQDQTPRANTDLARLDQTVPISEDQLGFASGFRLRVTGVTSDQSEMVPGGTYLIEGEYQVAPGRSARLALLPPHGSLQNLAPSQTTIVTSGKGHFKLMAKMEHDGSFNLVLLDSKETQTDLSRVKLLGRLRLIDGHQAALATAYDRWPEVTYPVQNAPKSVESFHPPIHGGQIAFAITPLASPPGAPIASSK